MWLDKCTVAVMAVEANEGEHSYLGCILEVEASEGEHSYPGCINTGVSVEGHDYIWHILARMCVLILSGGPRRALTQLKSKRNFEQRAVDELVVLTRIAASWLLYPGL